MPKEKLPKLYRRKWINKRKGTAYIVTSANMHSGWRDKTTRHADAEIEIKDCFKQMTLEFYYNNEKQYKQRLKKIDLLTRELMVLKQFMLDNPPVAEKKKAKDKETKTDGESIPAESQSNDGKESPPKRIIEASAIVRPVQLPPTTRADVAKTIAEG